MLLAVFVPLTPASPPGILGLLPWGRDTNASVIPEPNPSLLNATDLNNSGILKTDGLPILAAALNPAAFLPKTMALVQGPKPASEESSGRNGRPSIPHKYSINF